MIARLLHWFMCKAGWHSKPIFMIGKDKQFHRYCRWCEREMELDRRGSLFE